MIAAHGASPRRDMKAPGDGDDGSSHDDLIAEVIPLRRRLSGKEWQDSRAPPSYGVFEPPREPEPLGEYSVWETPASELVRREPPRSRARGLGPHLRLRRGALRQPWLAVGALLAIGLGVIALTAEPFGQRARAPVAVGQLNSPAGLGQALGDLTTRAPSSSRGGSVSSRRRTPSRSTATGTHGHDTTPSHAPATDRVVSSATTSASVSSTPSASASAGGGQGRAAGAPIATAAREFGFER
jgi:hypothetical protein